MATRFWGDTTGSLGLELTPTGANPAETGATASTVWFDSGTSVLRVGALEVITAAGAIAADEMVRGTGTSVEGVAAATLDASGNMSVLSATVVDLLTVTDSSFTLGISTSNPTVTFDTNDSLRYDRAGNSLDLVIGSTEVFNASAVGISVTDGTDTSQVTVNSINMFRGSGAIVYLSSRTNGNDLAFRTTTAGGSLLTAMTIDDSQNTTLPPGSSLTADDIVCDDITARTGSVITMGNRVEVEDANYYLEISGTTALINFDSTDYLRFDRTANSLDLFIGGSEVFSVGSTGQVTLNLSGAGVSNSALLLSSAVPGALWNETNGPVNEKYWSLYADSGVYILRTLDDAGASPVNVWTIDRTGVTPNTFSLNLDVTLSTGKTLTADDIVCDDITARTGSVVTFGDPITVAAVDTVEGGEIQLDPGTSYSGFLRIDQFADQGRISFDTTSNKSLLFTNFGAGSFSMEIQGPTTLSTGNSLTADDIVCDDITARTGSDVTINNKVLFNDAAFSAHKFSATQPYFEFDSNDLLVYDRTANSFDFFIGGSEVATLDATGLTLATGDILTANEINTDTIDTTSGGSGVIFPADCTFNGTVTVNNNIDTRSLTVLSTYNFYLAGPTVPGSAAAAGDAGQISWDASYIYVCTAANTWKRVAIATW